MPNFLKKLQLKQNKENRCREWAINICLTANQSAQNKLNRLSRLLSHHCVSRQVYKQRDCFGKTAFTSKVTDPLKLFVFASLIC